MRKLKLFSSLLVISALMLTPIARLNAQATVIGQSTNVQSIRRSSPPLTLNSAQGDGNVEIYVESTTITIDEEGQENFLIILGYKFENGTEGFASIKILPDASVIHDLNFEFFVAELEARDMLSVLANILNGVIGGKIGGPMDGVNFNWKCLVSIGALICAVAGTIASSGTLEVASGVLLVGSATFSVVKECDLF